MNNVRNSGLRSRGGPITNLIREISADFTSDASTCSISVDSGGAATQPTSRRRNQGNLLPMRRTFTTQVHFYVVSRVPGYHTDFVSTCKRCMSGYLVHTRPIHESLVDALNGSTTQSARISQVLESWFLSSVDQDSLAITNDNCKQRCMIMVQVEQTLALVKH